MSPFRIERQRLKAAMVSNTGDEFRSYLDRLTKMIPGEVLSLYLVGSGFIPENESPWWLVAWSGVCLLGVFAIRTYGTADPQTGKGPQWLSVLIAATAFVIWLYSLGGPFVAFGLHKPFVGSLLVLAWTFFVPFIYKGD